MMCGGFSGGRELKPEEHQLVLSMREHAES